MKEINLKNVKEIGYAAFQETSLKLIKNNHIQEINSYEFRKLIADVLKVKMSNLKQISTSAFENSTINEFDAPNLKSITVDFYDNN